MRTPELVALLALVLLTACTPSPVAKELSIAAATSLREVMPELVRAYTSVHPGSHVAVTYGASGDLKAQVEAGAPIDAVLFAGDKPLDELISGGRVDRASRTIVASNELVLVGKKAGPPLTFATLTKIADRDQLAVGDPRTVPAGQYARDFLTKLGEWRALESRLVYGSSVAAVLVYARRGEAVAGIVYRTELRGVDDLVVLDAASGPGAPHPKVVAGVVRGGSADADAFLAFVTSPGGEQVLASFGFGAP
jgi:molybdate transport system substrate-binding protein